MKQKCLLILCIVTILVLLPSNIYCKTVAIKHSLTRNGVKLFLEEHFDDELEKTFGNILLAHSLTYSSHEYDVSYKDYSLVECLVQNGYSVWLLDIAGYGRSGPVHNGFEVNSDYAAEDIAAATAYIREAKKVQKIDLLGWSWGTITSARFALTHSDWVRRLILYAPLIKGIDGDTPKLPEHANNWEHAADDFTKLPNGEIDDGAADETVVAVFTSNCWRYDGKGSPNGGRRDLMRGKDATLFTVDRLTMPVLLIGGTKDPLLYWSEIEKAYQSLPNNESNLVKINGGSHILMLEKAYYKRFQREVLYFLRK